VAAGACEQSAKPVPDHTKSVAELARRVEALEEAQRRDDRGVAILDFKHPGYGVAHDKHGPTVVIPGVAEPYLDGLKVTFLLINATGISLSDPAITVRFGPAETQSSRAEISGSFMPGYSKRVEMVLAPVKPEEFGMVAVGVRYAAVEWSGPAK